MSELSTATAATAATLPAAQWVADGLVHHEQGRLAEAARCYEQALASDTGHAQALHLLGVVAAQQGDHRQAIALIGRSIQARPDDASAHYNLGKAQQELLDFQGALASYERALALNPAYVEVHNNRGAALAALGQLESAVASYDRALALDPQSAQAHHNRGAALTRLGRREEALASYDRALALWPDKASLWDERGCELAATGQEEAAIASFERALALAPDLTAAFEHRIQALRRLGRLDEALAAYDARLAQAPGDADAWNNRGIVLGQAARHPEAIASFEKALAIQPDLAQAHDNIGLSLHALGRHAQALAHHERALALRPDFAEAHNHRGIALSELRRMDAALASYDRAIAIVPGYADAFNNRGAALAELGLQEAALVSYDQAIASAPGLAQAHHNRGITLTKLDRIPPALASFEKARELKPDYDFILGLCLRTRMQLCVWDGWPQSLEQYRTGVLAGQRVALPFSALGLLDDPQVHERAAATFAATNAPENGALGPIAARAPDGKIRLGYYSGDFHNHATMHLMAQLFERHDRGRFELFAFSFGPDIQDDMRKRAVASFDRFIDVRNMPDLDVARLSRELGIDIAVDLKGYTTDARMGIFACRCAPIQVSYLGYPGTTAVPYMDYVIADHTVITEAARPFWTEKIAWLPHSYQVNDTSRPISDRVFTREEAGLPASGVVFCCFNNTYKIVPEVFDHWMRILQAIPGSVLWLLSGEPVVADNLRRQAQARGVDAARLVFAPPLPLPDHLARHRLADLFLDTLPYNAHTTTSDALWAGLPVLTCAGKTFAARVAASLLRASGLPQLVTHSLADYEAMAIALGREPARIAELKQELARQRPTAPLFDTPAFTRHIEAAFRAMHERQLAGLPPQDLDVAP